MSAKSVLSHSIDSLSDAIDSVPFDSLRDLDAPDLSALTESLSDASTVMADTAADLGQHAGRLASRTAQSAWKNRETITTVAVIAIVVLAIAAMVKKKTSDDPDET